jgi:hypothetical protein
MLIARCLPDLHILVSMSRFELKKNRFEVNLKFILPMQIHSWPYLRTSQILLEALSQPLWKRTKLSTHNWHNQPTPHATSPTKGFFCITTIMAHENSDTGNDEPRTKACNNERKISLFPKLPLELQLRIWEFSIPGPRIVGVSSLSRSPSLKYKWYGWLTSMVHRSMSRSSQLRQCTIPNLSCRMNQLPQVAHSQDHWGQMLANESF